MVGRKVLSGMTFEEIAVEMQRPVETVKQLHKYYKNVFR
jgi:DNA-directed RNA polymerase specialized sigma24 family protein